MNSKSMEVDNLGFLDKIKQGATEVGKQAQLAVEVNRLKLQISGKQSEKEKQYSQIGEMVYMKCKDEVLRQVPELEKQYKHIEALEEEIAVLEKKLNDFKGLGCCSQCNEPIDTNVKFCSKCGAAQ